MLGAFGQDNIKPFATGQHSQRQPHHLSVCLAPIALLNGFNCLLVDLIEPK